MEFWDDINMSGYLRYSFPLVPPDLIALEHTSHNIDFKGRAHNDSQYKAPHRLRRPFINSNLNKPDLAEYIISSV